MDLFAPMVIDYTNQLKRRIMFSPKATQSNNLAPQRQQRASKQHERKMLILYKYWKLHWWDFHERNFLHMPSGERLHKKNDQQIIGYVRLFIVIPLTAHDNAFPYYEHADGIMFEKRRDCARKYFIRATDFLIHDASLAKLEGMKSGDLWIRKSCLREVGDILVNSLPDFRSEGLRSIFFDYLIIWKR